MTTSLGRPVSVKETAACRAKRANRLLAAPGTAFCSATTRGTRSRIAATPHGTLA